MKYKWLNRINNSKLIVFFNGWAMNESAIQNLSYDDFDILMINDYREFNFDFSQFDFDEYKEKYLICWSMGVYTVSLFKNIFDSFTKKIAINGTSKIIDDNFGIPDRIFNLTVKNLSDIGVKKFIGNMFNEKNKIQNLKIENSADELKNELISIKNLKISDFITFDKVYVSLEDKIIPPKNQINFWNGKAEIVKLQSSHCPFLEFNNWADLLC